MAKETPDNPKTRLLLSLLWKSTTRHALQGCLNLLRQLLLQLLWHYRFVSGVGDTFTYIVACWCWVDLHKMSVSIHSQMVWECCNSLCLGVCPQGSFALPLILYLGLWRLLGHWRSLPLVHARFVLGLPPKLCRDLRDRLY
jgi:hypothetical protein